jgi:hypothetical protein
LREDITFMIASDGPNTSRQLTPGKAAGLILKAAVTVLCFWYATRSISFADLGRLLGSVSAPWAALSVLLIVTQIPLAGLRWCKIIDALDAGRPPAPRSSLLAITAISIFFGQIAPNVIGDTVRIWMVARLGRPWRQGLVSVLIDRGVGVGVLLAVAFCTLLFPSGLAALGGNRITVLTVFGLTLATGLCALAAAPMYIPLLLRWPASHWLGRFILASRQVLVLSPARWQIVGIAALVHSISVFAVWSLGRAQGFDLSAIDSAVLFVIIAAVALVPITIGSWGLRELAISSLLQAHGVSSEKALFFSISFGLTLLAASSVGAVVWAVYSPMRSGALP